MNRYQAILFDCDGVLLDSEPLGCRALFEAINGAGVALSLDEVVTMFSGNSAQASYDALVALGLTSEVFDEADRILFAMFEQEVPLISGIEAVLADYPQAMAVCSNALIRRLDRSLMQTKIAARFGEHVYSAEMVAAGKPAPDMIYYACDRLGIRPEQAIFVDDNTHGVLAARAAGCLAVGFCGPSEHRAGHAARLHAAGAHHVVTSMQELHALLATLPLSTQKEIEHV